MPIVFNCPACNAELRINEAAAGRQGKCPHCKAPILVPSTVPPTPSSARSEPPAAPPSSAKSSPTAAPPGPPKSESLAAPPIPPKPAPVTNEPPPPSSVKSDGASSARRAGKGLLDRLVEKRLLRLSDSLLQKRVFGLPVAAWLLLSGEFLIGMGIVLLAYLVVSISRS